MNALEEFLASLRRRFGLRARPPAEPLGAPTSDRPPPEESPLPPAAPCDADSVAEVRALLEAMSEAPVAAPDPVAAPAAAPQPAEAPAAAPEPAAAEPAADVRQAAVEPVMPAALDEGVAEPGGPVPDLASGTLVLTLTTPPATYTIARSTATLGRGEDNTICLDDLSVSRRHARIAYRRAGYWLSDLGSMGGTWVNGSRLAAPHEIGAGDIIDIGHCRLTVSYARDAAKVDAKVTTPSRRPARR